MVGNVLSSDFNAEFFKKFEVLQWRHGLTILKHEFNEQYSDLLSVLNDFWLYKSMITVGGGGKSKVADLFDKPLYNKGWVEKSFDISLNIDGTNYETPTHKIDCVKGRVALDVEWNNKTPFFDRDLNNFRLLHGLGAISLGILITRADELQNDVFDPLRIGHKYGASTTQLKKLLPKIEGGSAGGCPLIVFAVKTGCYIDDTI